MPLGDIGNILKNAVVGTIKGVGDVLGSTIDITRENTVKALQGARDVGQEATGLVMDSVSGVVQGAVEVGSDVGTAAKGAVIGTIQGVGEVTTVTAGTLSDTVRAAIKGTREVGGDVVRSGPGRCRRRHLHNQRSEPESGRCGFQCCAGRHKGRQRSGQRSRNHRQVRCHWYRRGSLGSGGGCLRSRNQQRKRTCKRDVRGGRRYSRSCR